MAAPEMIDTTMATGGHCHDSSLHLFVDDYHIRNRFAMKRVYGKLEKYPEPVVEDMPGRGISWACRRRGRQYRRSGNNPGRGPFLSQWPSGGQALVRGPLRNRSRSNYTWCDRRGCGYKGRGYCHQSLSDFSTARKALWGMLTDPIIFIRFLPFFCFSSSLRLRLMSPP